MSDDIAELAAALAKAQAEIKGAEKSRTNPAFKSKYSTLADVWDACREPLTKNGLSIVQLPSCSDGVVRVTTVLLHSSGQSIRETLELPAMQKTPQGIGSAITYGRRFGLASMVGVAPDEDDDGAAALVRSYNGHDQRRDHPRDQPRQRPEPTKDDAPIESKDDDMATNTKELRDECTSLAAKLRRHTGKTVVDLRKSASLPTSGSLNPLQLAKFIAWCKRELANYEDPAPDDLPAWSLTPGVLDGSEPA